MKTAGKLKRPKIAVRKKSAKAETRQTGPLPSSFRLLGDTFLVLRSFWTTLGGIMLVYLILNILFTGSFGAISSAVSESRQNIEDGAGGAGDRLGSAAAGFGALVFSQSAGSSPAGSVIQTALVIIASLAIIWSLRQLIAGKAISVKQAFYGSMYPLVPFLLVVLVIIIQLLPMTLGAAALEVFNTVFTGQTAIMAAATAVFLILAAWSVYMVSSSIFALYIVTLPEMQPREALRSAKNLVRSRRFAVLRKLFFLPLFIAVSFAVVIILLILVYAPLAAIAFYILSTLTLLLTHTYLYNLYRSML